MEIAVVVNLRSRRGSPAVASKCIARLPQARVLSSRSADEVIGFARQLASAPAELVVSAGGDGTAVALLNAMRANPPPGGPWWRHSDAEGPVLGLLPLGTGNGWAHATGAPGWRHAVDQLADLSRRRWAVPRRRYDLVEAFGLIAPFAGTGWDAEIIDDFHSQKEGWGLLPAKSRQGVAGYLHGLATRTVPRHLLGKPRAEVELINTGEDAMAVDETGRAVPLRGGENGKVLYRGPVNVCAAGTSPEWGFGFRAFPFANLVRGRFNMRIYSGRVDQALVQMPSLWRGVHPLRNMHTWMLTRCEAHFSRAVPFQVGGDRLGYRDHVEYGISPEPVDVVDWRALRNVA